MATAITKIEEGFAGAGHAMIVSVTDLDCPLLTTRQWAIKQASDGMWEVYAGGPFLGFSDRRYRAGSQIKALNFALAAS